MNGREYLGRCEESYHHARALADIAAVNTDDDAERPGALKAELTEENAPAVVEAIALAADRFKVWEKCLATMKARPGLLLTELDAFEVATIEAAAKDKS